VHTAAPVSALGGWAPTQRPTTGRVSISSIRAVAAFRVTAGSGSKPTTSIVTPRDVTSAQVVSIAVPIATISYKVALLSASLTSFARCIAAIAASIGVISRRCAIAAGRVSFVPFGDAVVDHSFLSFAIGIASISSEKCEIPCLSAFGPAKSHSRRPPARFFGTTVTASLDTRQVNLRGGNAQLLSTSPVRYIRGPIAKTPAGG